MLTITSIARVRLLSSPENSRNTRFRNDKTGVYLRVLAVTILRLAAYVKKRDVSCPRCRRQKILFFPSSGQELRGVVLSFVTPTCPARISHSPPAAIAYLMPSGRTCLDRRLRRISIRLYPTHCDKSRICHNLRDFATKFVRNPG